MIDIFSVNPASVDPNLIFLALIVSLWIGVTAAHVPGTGVLEGIALLALAGVLVVMAQLEIHWLAVVLVVVGIGVFSLVPFINPRYISLALGGLILQAAGSFFMFKGDSVNILVIVVMLILPLGYYMYILLPILENARKQPVIEKDDLLIGAVGRVTTTIDPVGTIRVHSESWTATSDQIIKEGTQVRVLERRGLQLVVEGVKEKRRETFDEKLEEA